MNTKDIKELEKELQEIIKKEKELEYYLKSQFNMWNDIFKLRDFIYVQARNDSNYLTKSKITISEMKKTIEIVESKIKNFENEM